MLNLNPWAGKYLLFLPQTNVRMAGQNIKRIYYLIIFWFLYSLPFLILTLLFVLLFKGKLGFVPTFEDLENPKNNLASEVYSCDSVLLGKFYLENRTYVDFNELSPNIVNALIATEDIRFHRHSGVDARGLVRVFIKSIILGQESSGGGSTITQQLAKNLYPRDTTYYDWAIRRKIKLVVAKFKEWNTAVKLERNYTKNEIIVMYLNTVPFGHNAYGIKSAAKVYFDTTPDSLKAEQAAMLVGLLKAQSRYSPVNNPERAMWRRNIVLNQMRKYEYITEEEFDSLSVMPIILNFRIQDHEYGLATYFRQYLQMTLGADKPDRDRYFLYSYYQRDSIEWEENPIYGWVNKNRKPDGTPYSLYRDGLKIYTTVDSRMQAYAEQAMTEHLGGYLQNTLFRELKNNPQAPFSEDLTSGDIKNIMMLAMRNTERYNFLRRTGESMDSIMKAFNTPVPMKIFTWNGDRDTFMTPMDSLRYYKYFFRGGLMAVEPATGYVKAYVGGPNFRYFKYDHVTIGKRQVGSTFKPFLYTLAMQEGYSPCYEIPNVPQTFRDQDSIWTPRSGGTEYLGKMVTLKWGLAHSVNNISAWLVKQFPPQTIIDDVARKVGIKSDLMPVPSIIFGTSDVSLYEMVGGFNTFVNKGVYIQPIFITRIEDKNGNVLATFMPKQSEAFNAKTAYLMIDLLKGVVDGGTGIRLRYAYEFTAEMAGKTGTTQNHSDGWYIGMTPKLVAGVWVGAEDRSVHFDNLSLGSGANMALPIYGLFMKKIYENTALGITQEDVFEIPPDFNVHINCNVATQRGENTDEYNYELLEEEF
jgi:penicillin-binding protein 1A